MRVAGLVCVRIASRSCSAAMIQKTVSSRKFRLRGSVVGGMRCMSLLLTRAKLREIAERLGMRRTVNFVGYPV
jgi:hypothetical protein